MDGYLGTIMMCGFNFAPRNYAFCMGGSVPISQNTALYSLLGSRFGGDDRTTFNLPNLGGGRLPGGQGDAPGLSPRDVGQFYGQEINTLTTNQLPAHNHGVAEQVPGKTLQITSSGQLQANKSNSDSPSPENNYAGPIKSGMKPLDSYATTPDTTMNSGAIDIQSAGTIDFHNLTISNTGLGQPFSIVQPTLILNFVICISGLYPERS